MSTEPRSHRPAPYRYRSTTPRTRRPRKTLLVLAGIVVPLALVGGAGAVLAATRGRPPAPPPPPDPNPNCTLVVPAQPLTAKGLASPYRLMATDRRKGACHEAVADQAAFVEAAILDPKTGAVSVYHPLVTDDSRQPAAAPVVPTLPAGAVVGIWFGYNGDTLTLRGTDRGTLADAKCVNGLGRSLFGQYAYCNAVAWFQAANAAIAAKKLVIPDTGTGKDGLPCPTVRDFSVVDQDMSDNVVSSYLILDKGRTAPNTAANRKRFGNKATVLTNGSDNGLLDKFVAPALGCTPLTAPDLGDPGVKVPSQALNELSAAAHTRGPAALVPTNDPMTVVDDKVSVAKTNLYRAGVNQPALAAGDDTGRQYCRRLINIAPARLFRDRRFFLRTPSPDPDAAKNLFGFLAQRLKGSFDLLGCKNLLHRRNPIRLQTDGKAAVNATAVDQNGTAVDPAAVPPPAPDATPSPGPTTTGPEPEPSVSAKHN